MNAVLVSFVILALTTIVECTAPFKTCTSTNNVKSVTVSGCESAPCLLHHGTNATIGVEFTAGMDAAKLESKVYGIIGGVPIPFPLPSSDGCKGCGLTCPIKNGSLNKFQSVIEVKKSYPKLKLYVKWELVDTDKKKDMFCILIPVAITD